jgi:hypothetical protein
MPKILSAALFTIILSVSVYAETPKVAFGVNLGPTFQTFFNYGGLGIGATAECAFLDNISGVAMFSFASYHSSLAGDVAQVSPGIQLRWYPMTAAVAGFWLGPRYQYAIVTANGSGSAVSRGISVVVLDAGFKILLNRGVGMFLEPYVGYGMAFDIKTVGTLDYGIAFGYAF